MMMTAMMTFGFLLADDTAALDGIVLVRWPSTQGRMTAIPHRLPDRPRP
jgi:hypothetical protein